MASMAVDQGMEFRRTSQDRPRCPQWKAGSGIDVSDQFASFSDCPQTKTLSDWFMFLHLQVRLMMQNWACLQSQFCPHQRPDIQSEASDMGIGQDLHYIKYEMLWNIKYVVGRIYPLFWVSVARVWIPGHQGVEPRCASEERPRPEPWVAIQVGAQHLSPSCPDARSAPGWCFDEFEFGSWWSWMDLGCQRGPQTR